MLYIRLNMIYKLMVAKLFSNFKLIFELAIGQKSKNIQTNSEVWILIKVQYHMSMDLFRQGLVYKLMETFFFQILKYFFEFILMLPNNQFFKNLSLTFSLMIDKNN